VQRTRLLYIIFFLLACGHAVGQDGHEFFHNNTAMGDDAVMRELTTDIELFFSPLRGAGSLFDALSEFSFSAVRYNRRGYPHALTRDFWGGIDISGTVARNTDFALLGMLRRGERLRPDGTAARLNASAREFPADIESIIVPGMRISAFTYNRRGRLGGRISGAGELYDGTYAGALFEGRGGRDGGVRGVFSQEFNALGGVDFELSERHGLSFLIGAASAENGLRSAATQEAFELTGDRLYNPAWGYYGGRERSARVACRTHVYPLVSYVGRLSPATEIMASAWCRVGEEGRSALQWFAASPPQPDYYRYMPGYEATNPATGWTVRDPRVTQIFWEQLAEQNLNRGDAQIPAYIISDRMEAVVNAQFAVSIRTQLDRRFALIAGVRHDSDRRRHFRKLRDLLGAGPMLDVDQYLLDDERFGDFHLNNKRAPDRLVSVGDRFGHDYRFAARRTEIHAALLFAQGRVSASAALEVGEGALWREGFYEKELFPGSGSLGCSREFAFNPYSAKISVGYNFSVRRMVNFSAVAAEMMPRAGAVFLNPDFSNAAIAAPCTVGLLSADAEYAAVFNNLTLTASAFATRTSNETAAYRYWDDVESLFADMSLAGIDKLFYGVEFAARWDASPRVAFSLAAALGSYTYDSDPLVTIADNATQRTIVSGSRSRLRGYSLATSPERVVTAEVRYGGRGWLASLTGSYMGGRYVDVSPLRRMERAYGLAESPEKHREFVGQQRLGDAFIANLFVLRSFRMTGGGAVTLLASVNNLLGRDDIVYSGYEQMRIARGGSSPNHNWRPFPSKYLYAYGRTYFISASYAF